MTSPISNLERHHWNRYFHYKTLLAMSVPKGLRADCDVAAELMAWHADKACAEILRNEEPA